AGRAESCASGPRQSARHDAVDERVPEINGLGQPGHEAFAELPPPRELADDVPERRTVSFDQLARKDDDTAFHRELEVSGALVQETRKLPGERARRMVVERIGFVERDPDFSRV